MSDLYKVSGKMIKVDETTLTTDAQGALETIRATNNEAIAGTDTNKALTPASGKALVDDVINTRLTNAVIYRGEWAITTSTTDYSGLDSFKPIKIGDYFRITGTGTATIEGVEYNPQDSIVFKQNVAVGTTITKSMFDHNDHTDASDTVYLNATQTLTNKTLSASSNTISNLTTSNLASGVLKTAMSGTPSDTAILSEKAVSDAITASSPHVDDVTIEKYKAQVGDEYDTLRVKDGGIGISKINPSALTTLSGETNTTIPTYAKVGDMIENAHIEATYAGEIVQVSKTFTTSGNHVEFTEQCQTKAYISVYQDRIYVYPSEYTLDNDGMGITFTQNIAAGTVVEVNYFRGIPNSKVDELIAAAETVNPDNYAVVDLSNLSSTGEAHFQAPITGAASTITSSDLTASKALVSDANGKISTSSVTSTELGYVSGVTSAIQTQLSNKASTDLSNSPYTTNRILEIPQDIKLELNNGTLTLKAGSKVYVPNGANNFDVYTTSQDYTADTSAYSGFYVISVTRSNGTINGVTAIQNCISGTTAPTSPTALQGWYDTTNNIIKRYSGGSEQTLVRFSFPLCSITSDGTNITSIDQIFNGFGYIGSTVFVLPGVKVQTTFERNADGTYKSEIWSIQSVLTNTRSSSGTNLQWYVQKKISDGTTAVNAILHYYSSSTIPSTGPTFSLIWCEEDGGWYSTGSTGTATKLTNYYFLKVFSSDADSTGKISNFKTCSVDSVVNNNASNFSAAGRSYLSGMGMPSSNYEEWTLGASGATYTAPANGWVTISKAVASDAQYVTLINSTSGLNIDCFPNQSPATCRLFIPTKKGDALVVSYNATGSTNFFRFVYAEGEN